jgi:uncharacterized protein DUF2523
MDWLMDPINEIIDFLYDDIYDFFVESFAYLVEQITLGSIKFTVWSIGFAWDIAEQIIVDIGLSSAMDSAWSALPGDMVSTLAFFGIPTGISMLLNSFITRYTLRFIPFSGY